MDYATRWKSLRLAEDKRSETVNLARSWVRTSPDSDKAWSAFAISAIAAGDDSALEEALDGREALRMRTPLQAPPIFETDLVFIHLPKTAGLSIAKMGLDSRRLLSIGHKLVSSDGAARYHPYFSAHFPSAVPVSPQAVVFTNIRNIFAFINSLYFASLEGRKNRSNLVDAAAAKRGFDYFVRFIGERDGIWPDRNTLFPQMYDYPAGRWVVDWINRVETLQADMSALFGMSLGLTVTVPEINRSPFKEARRDYRLAYDNKLMQFVADTWRADIQMFGFEFDRPYSETGAAHRWQVCRDATFRFPQ